MPSENNRRVVVLIERIGLWLVWGPLLLSSLSFAGVETLIFLQPSSNPQPPFEKIVPLLAVAAIGGACTIAFFHALRFFILRSIVRKNSWTALAIAYPIVKIVTWAACQGVVFFSLVVCLIAQTFWPAAIIAAAAWMTLAIDLPLLRPFRLAQDWPPACRPS
jgi:hypothetical protein